MCRGGGGGVLYAHNIRLDKVYIIGLDSYFSRFVTVLIKVCTELAVFGFYHRYCKTTNFSMLLILAILANGIKTLILIPANINTQSHGRTR